MMISSYMRDYVDIRGLFFGLKNIRQFYKVYSADRIGEIVFSQFENLPAVDTGRKFYLSWSHYLKLMRIENIEERHFYEIESVKNDWSLSELKHQDIGQMQMYVNYYDRKFPLDNPEMTQMRRFRVFSVSSSIQVSASMRWESLARLIPVLIS